MKKQAQYLKAHLILSRNSSASLCGRRVARRACTTVKEFEDYGFDGDIEDLCDQCQAAFDLQCNLFTKAIADCAAQKHPRRSK